MNETTLEAIASAIKVIQNDMQWVKKEVEEIRQGVAIAKLDERYVTRTEFWVVRAIVYSGAGTVLLAVLGAIVTLVLIET